MTTIINSITGMTTVAPTTAALPTAVQNYTTGAVGAIGMTVGGSTAASSNNSVYLYSDESEIKDFRFDYEKLTGDTFRNSRDRYATSFSLHRKFHDFHFRVWLASKNPAITDYGFSGDFTNLTPDLCFGSAASRAEFEEWWEKYSVLYSDETDQNKFPLLPDRERISVTPFKFDMNSYQNAPLAVEIWAWIISSCAGRVWYMGRTFYFEQDADAVAFRLRWI